MIDILIVEDNKELAELLCDFLRAENYTVSQGIQYWLAMSDEHNLMMTAAASAIVPVVVLFLFTQRYFVESIATTGVKG